MHYSFRRLTDADGEYHVLIILHKDSQYQMRKSATSLF